MSLSRYQLFLFHNPAHTCLPPGKKLVVAPNPTFTGSQVMLGGTERGEHRPRQHGCGSLLEASSGKPVEG